MTSRTLVFLFVFILLFLGIVSCRKDQSKSEPNGIRIVEKPSEVDDNRLGASIILRDPLEDVKGEYSKRDLLELKKAERTTEGTIIANKGLLNAGLRVAKYFSFKGKTEIEVKELIGDPVTEDEVKALRRNLHIPKGDSVMVYILDDGLWGYYFVLHLSEGKVTGQELKYPLW